MTDTATPTETFPPASPPASPPARRTVPLARVLTALGVLIVVAALVTAIVVQHGKATDARADAHRLQVTLSDTQRDLHKTQGDLRTADSDNESLTGQVDALTKTVEQCSVYPEIATHLFRAASAYGDAAFAGFNGMLTKTSEGNRELKKVTDLFDANQSFGGELQDACGPASGTTT